MLTEQREYAIIVEDIKTSEYRWQSWGKEYWYCDDHSDTPFKSRWELLVYHYHKEEKEGL